MDKHNKTRQRAALQEAVEGLKGELAEAKEAGEAAAKDAARAAQVLSDLGEQVRSHICMYTCVRRFWMRVYVCARLDWFTHHVTRTCR